LQNVRRQLGAAFRASARRLCARAAHNYVRAQKFLDPLPQFGIAAAGTLKIDSKLIAA
jgi:hypothetical protein